MLHLYSINTEQNWIHASLSPFVYFLSQIVLKDLNAPGRQQEPLCHSHNWRQWAGVGWVWGIGKGGYSQVKYAFPSLIGYILSGRACTWEVCHLQLDLISQSYTHSSTTIPEQNRGLKGCSTSL